MKSYRALVVHETGPRFESRPYREAASGEILIEVHYSSLNYRDALALTRKSPIMRTLPLVGGIDAAGRVVESSDARFAAGDRVLVTGYELSQTHDGGFAEYLCLPADWAVPLPQALSPFEAMALGTAGFTAGLAVQRMLDNGQAAGLGPVAVTGATGGVGSTAIDILDGLGFEVTAITGKAESSEKYLRVLGAADVVDRHSLQVGARPLEKGLWGGAVDTVGGAVLSWLTRTTRPHGNIACCGLTGGVEVETTVMPFILRGIALLGVDSAACPMPLRQRLWSRLAGDMRPRHLDRIVAATVTLDEVPGIAETMLAGNIRGRYVVAVKP
jgi:NADPH2:quinone reductase